MRNQYLEQHVVNKFNKYDFEQFEFLQATPQVLAAVPPLPPGRFILDDKHVVDQFFQHYYKQLVYINQLQKHIVNKQSRPAD